MKKEYFGLVAVCMLLSAACLSPAPEPARASGTNLEESLAAGYAFIESGELEEALNVFETAAAAWPESTEALQALGVTCYRLDLYERGAEVLEALVSISPDSAPTHSRLGFVYSQLNLQRKAVEAHSRAISIDPEIVPAHWGKGLAYKQLGFYEEAAKSFREVIRLRPDFAEAHYDLAEACLIMHEHCTAIEEYNILRGLDKELADRLFDLMYK